MNNLENLTTELESKARSILDEIAALRVRETKAGAKRIRKLTNEMGKTAKAWRKLSVQEIG